MTATLFGLVKPLLSLLWPSATMARHASPLLALPPELLTQILEFLPPQALTTLSRTSHALHAECQNDLLWAKYIGASVPYAVPSPSPCSSWRELYIAHHPFWFLPRFKIWFADRNVGGSALTGCLLLARYDHRRGCIEAYRLVAEHGNHTFESWDWNPDVIIHTFNPKVRLWLDDPVVKLDLLGSPSVGGGASSSPSPLRRETRMGNSSDQGLASMISLCQGIPPARQHRSMALWPPRKVPCRHRVRTESANMFRDESHKPRTHDEASDQAFRIRRWLEMRSMEGHIGVRLGEDVMTFSTLLEESYTPTAEKPWQGIWVGDYSGHGCEFLLVLQKDIDPNRPPIRARTWDSLSGSEEESDGDDGPAANPAAPSSPSASSQPSQSASSMVETPNENAEGPADPSCRGRLEAIKLTGDPNIPRGEYTWIAEDIGPKGYLRTANEQMFKGARVVKSFGHVAAREYRHGMC